MRFWRTRGIVEQASEVPRPESPSDRISLHEDGESEAGGSEDATVNLRSLPVQVLAYQTAPRYDNVWIARGEAAQSWMTRVAILLTPPGGLHDILLPPCQPFADICASFRFRSGLLI